MTDLSLNLNAVRLAQELIKDSSKYKIKMKQNELGTSIVDAGIEAKGGFSAGKLITDICLGGIGEVNLSTMYLDGLMLPSITVQTDHPAIATLASQMAGWHIKNGSYSAVGSGPARALAKKPKALYERIGYTEKFDSAVIVLETSLEPPAEVIKYISGNCEISPEKLYVVLVPTASVAGFTQVSGRIAETCVHKLVELGLDAEAIEYAWGCSPILPVHPDPVEAMGRTNDAILYGGAAYCIVNHEDDKALGNMIEQAVSSFSDVYGRLFTEIFREANFNFYNIESSMFSPAMLTVSNAKTGRTHSAGKIDTKMLKKSIGL